ncbi:MAG: glutamyl-tRNA reductase, partial [Algoriphagus sp.]
MPVKFRALSLSHKNAPVQIREIISLDEQDVQVILLKIKDFFSLNNALVLSTCNRTEVYYTHERDISTEIIKLIGL